MKTDLYTKIILTIIAACLIIMIIKPVLMSKNVIAQNDNTVFGGVYFDVLQALDDSVIEIEQPIDVRGSVRQIYPIEVEVVN